MQVITFKNTHTAMEAEDVLGQLGYDFELIPTPREISAECGFALLVRESDSQALKEICQMNRIEYSGIYRRKIEKGARRYEKDY